MLSSYTLPQGEAIHIGTFVKTPAPQIVEVLALAGLDFVVVDAEHAPFDLGSLDLMVLAARAAGLPVWVRVPDQGASTLARILDLGVNGVLVPHVDSAEQAAAVVRHCRHLGGVRGYSGSPRASGYGSLGMREALRQSERVTILCQIESGPAVKQAEAIAAVPGVGGIFMGRADLALSMDLDDANHPDVKRAADEAIASGLRAGRLVAAFVANRQERLAYAQAGVRWFVQSSDQALLRGAAAGLRA
ncbi:MAG: aldolase/citrate lyase family protein [Pigmentiphaga sp.]|nr:aldolase/citrate lyase family protein [Pigmentiphaga sp.]